MIHNGFDIHDDLEIRAEACVIGSGAGGAVVAKELQEAGLKVVLLEEGPYVTLENLPVSDMAKTSELIYRDGGTLVILGKPSIIYTEGRVVGGSTFMNGGMCWRTPPKILKQWQWQAGLADFSADKMTRHFERVEAIIQARPMIAEARNRDGELFKLGADRLGYKIQENIRSQNHCVGANQCMAGCPTGAKQSTATTYVPAFLQAGGELYTRCRVHEILTQGNRAVGVAARFIDAKTGKAGRRLTVRAPIVVCSAGAVQTPALLKRSGIRDAGGQLGRNLMVHPNAKVVAVFNERIEAWKGVNQSHQIVEFFEEGILMAINFVPPGILAMILPAKIPDVLQVLQDEYHHMINGAVLIDDTGTGRVRTGPLGSVWPTYDINAHDFRKTLRAVALMCEVFFAAGAKKCYLPFHEPWVIHGVDEIQKIFSSNIKPQDVEMMTLHIMGTARMGSDPRASVVDSHGECHNVSGLFVADASVFPSAIGVNPQITIMALATRTAEFIAEHRRNYG